jgi:hypothetical protein
MKVMAESSLPNTPAASSPTLAERIAELREQLEQARAQNIGLSDLCAAEAENLRTHVFQAELDAIEKRLRKAADVASAGSALLARLKAAEAVVAAAERYDQAKFAFDGAELTEPGTGDGTELCLAHDAMRQAVRAWRAARESEVKNDIC